MATAHWHIACHTFHRNTKASKRANLIPATNFLTLIDDDTKYS
jgi:hypothetical protein